MVVDSLRSYIADFRWNTIHIERFSYELLIGVCALVVAYIVSSYLSKRKKNFPPGPRGLPIVGFLPFLQEKPFIQFREIAKKYGPVFSIRMGLQDVVVLNNGEVIREAFSKPELLGRPPNSAFSLANIETPFFMNGPKWLEQRRFSLHALRDHGLGKAHMQDRIREEIRCFLNAVEQEKEKPCDVVKLLSPSMSNNICSLVFGNRYEYDDPDRQFLDKALDDTLELLTQTNFYLFFPSLLKIPFFKRVVTSGKFMKCMNTMFDFFRKEIAEHKKSFDRNNIRDLIDSYLIEMEKARKDPDTSFTEEMLLGLIENLFGAGSETVRTTISWCLYTVAAYPDVQKKVQKEIDEVIGRERLPATSDTKQLPYTQSVLMEVQRWQTVVPLNVLRYTLEDTTLAGYDIRKGTTVIGNLWAAHNDPERWKEPEKFVPERFLSEDRKSVIKTDDYLVFSYGKRSCPGEGLAILETFLYFTSIMQKYTVKLPEGQKPDFDGIMTITYFLKPYKLCFYPR